jgi:hypothetical protein
LILKSEKYRQTFKNVLSKGKAEIVLEESITCSFIIKIWIEETLEETGKVIWRGRVTHVPSGERRYINTLKGISSFIEPYLEKWEQELDPY